MNRGLTAADAERGVQPAPLSKAEWGKLWAASLLAEMDARDRHALALLRARQSPVEAR
jgi:hypothetical protein